MKPLTTITLMLTLFTVGLPTAFVLFTANPIRFVNWWDNHGMVTLTVLFLVICVLRESRRKP